MALFISSAAAVRCAAWIQRDLAQRRQDKRGHQLKVRIGGAAREPVEHENDIFGSTVQLAARLRSHAEPNRIRVSNVVAELCMGKGLTFRSLGEVPLKGVEQPVRIHAVELS